VSTGLAQTAAQPASGKGAPSSAGTQRFSDAGKQAVSRQLNEAVRRGDTPGVVALVVGQEAVLYEGAAGKLDVAHNIAMPMNAIFAIASMTKPVTSVAVMMLMEEGKLKLDDPITKWAPEFANMQVLKDAQGPVEDTYPSPRDITVEDLMTHRSGLAYGFTSIGPIAHAHQKALGDVLNSDTPPDVWMKALGSLPLSYPPGERFHYSHATDVLGFLVGRIEGKPFREVLSERIFGPLGMVDTDFWIPPEKQARAAVVYKLKDANNLEPVVFRAYEQPPAFTGGGGGLVSTVDDYLKFARMLLGGGEVDGVRLLKPKTVALMTTNRLTDAQREITFMGLPFWAGQGFGLGLSVITDIDKQSWMGAGTNGAFSWPGAFGTWWRADPAENMIMIYMIQNSMELGPEAASQLATGQRMAAMAALPTFQNLTYAALGR